MWLRADLVLRARQLDGSPVEKDEALATELGGWNLVLGDGGATPANGAKS